MYCSTLYEGKSWSEFYRFVNRLKETGKIFLQSKTAMEGSSLIL
jgi:hypothetical protein